MQRVFANPKGEAIQNVFINYFVKPDFHPIQKNKTTSAATTVVVLSEKLSKNEVCLLHFIYFYH
jgi:hypothetical protein